MPFNVRIPNDEKDPQLREKLLRELPGILAWCVEGARQWSMNGLCVPDPVHKATQAYRDDMDVIGAFIGDCCVIGAHTTAVAGELYARYKDWCIESGEMALSNRAFADQLKERGCTNEKRASNGRRLWLGIGLRTEGSEGSEGLVAASMKKKNDNSNDATNPSDYSDYSDYSETGVYPQHALTEDVLSNGQGSPPITPDDDAPTPAPCAAAGPAGATQAVRDNRVLQAIKAKIEQGNLSGLPLVLNDIRDAATRRYAGKLIDAARRAAVQSRPLEPEPEYDLPFDGLLSGGDDEDN